MRLARTIDAARLRAQELRATQWSGPLVEVDSMLTELDEQLRRVPEAQRLVRLLGDGLDALLGYGTPARYVILGQNDHEIRATGGFIGTVGFVTIEGGEVTASEYRGVSDFDRPAGATIRPAPETLALYSGSSEWWLKEVNHYPQFAVSAELALQFLADDFGIVADGSMPLTPGEDFLAVVDSNYSQSKIQPAIEKQISYLQRDDGTVDLTITWRNTLSTFEGERYERLGRSGVIFDINTSTFLSAPGVFGNFTRVYLPPGSLLLSVDGFDSAPRYELESGLAVVGGFIAVRDGELRTLRLSYVPWGDAQAIPAAVRVWKQGGATATSLRVARTAGGEQVVVYEGPFERDLAISLR